MNYRKIKTCTNLKVHCYSVTLSASEVPPVLSNNTLIVNL